MTIEMVMIFGIGWGIVAIITAGFFIGGIMLSDPRIFGSAIVLLVAEVMMIIPFREITIDTLTRSRK